MYHFVYLTRNLINGKFYIGKHSTENLNDGYLGSGKYLWNSVKKYGEENFSRRILKFFNSDDEALEYEKKIVNEKLLKNPMCMNIGIGGHGNGFRVKDKNGNTISLAKGKAHFVDKNGKVSYISVDDPRVKSGELVNIRKGYVVVKDKDNNILNVPVNDPRYLSGELVSINKNKVIVINKEGNIFKVNKDDPRYLSGELKWNLSGKINVMDKDGNFLSVDRNDPRYLSGELVGCTKGRVNVRDKDGKIFAVRKDDPRYLSGELVHLSKGYISTKDKDGNKYFVKRDDPRIKTGELKVNYDHRGYIIAIDKDGNFHRVKINDQRIKTKELVEVQKGIAYYINRETFETEGVLREEIKRNREKYFLCAKYTVAKDKDGNLSIVRRSDKRLKTGELVAVKFKKGERTNGN